ncbi:hypothetical protein N7520_005281 [Penicillium odoratum]|uniref:uncharacterized protein n=1 Tax=Penicillium odoratum TaxID=1167516 RepID=UPI00254934FE|nr:uncharacterized protein N7520_005281 [Penicillium odoratum]KAJ5765722.1 hypothetical protein N7520_005281 [Penicillium odoratum]
MTNLIDLLNGASRLRSGVPCSFADENPRVGGSHHVFQIIIADSVHWAARISINPNTWKEIKAPNIFVDEERRVLYSEWVIGKPLAIWNHEIHSIKRLRMLAGLAEFLLYLWTTPVPSDLVTNKDCRYSTWLMESLDQGLRRILAGTARWGNAVNYLIMRSMVSNYAAEFDNTSTGIGFSHGDLNAYNIMTNEDLSITGVVDWDWTSVAPLPAIIHHPWFMADIPGWNNDGVSDGENFLDDRLSLQDFVRRKEISQKLPLTVSTLLKDSGKRLYFQSAFHFKYP